MNASRDSFLGEPSRDDVLDNLLIRVEQLWRDSDKSGLDDLIRRHPEFSAEMQEFFADLAESDDPVDGDFQEAEENIYHWLRTRGIDEALSTAARLRREVTSPTTWRSNRGPEAGEEPPGQEGQSGQVRREPWLAFLGQRLGRKKTELAASLPNVTLEFLSLVSRYPHLVPDRVKDALSRSVQEHFGVPAEESLQHLSGAGVVLKRAASRRGPGGGPPESFEQLLERGALGPAAKLFWRECAQRQD
jgi:hypothetical protein